MSYVGPPFDDDLFVSYARAEKQTEASDLLKWSLNFADRLAALLRTSLNAEGDDRGKISVFLDRDGIESGDDLPDGLQKAVGNSALLLVLLSPYYPKSRWCLEELRCHYAKAAAEGRTRHCSVVYVQPVLDADWPEQLRDHRSGPLAYRDLIDPETQLPLGIDDFDEARLKAGIRSTFVEIQGRLKELRKQLAARRTLDAQRQAPAERPVIYLHGRARDLGAWRSVRDTLDTKVFVQPPTLDDAAEDGLAAGRRKRKLDEYAECNGLALLRTSGADSDLDLMMMYRDRQRLLQERHIDLPWAVIDEVGDEWPMARNFRAPQIMTSDRDWPDRLLETLFQR